MTSAIISFCSCIWPKKPLDSGISDYKITERNAVELTETTTVVVQEVATSQIVPINSEISSPLAATASTVNTTVDSTLQFQQRVVENKADEDPWEVVDSKEIGQQPTLANKIFNSMKLF